MTITGPLSPCLPSFRTNVYATPAPKPPITPIKAFKNCIFMDGFTTKTAPINAVTTHSHSVLFAFSLSTKYDMIMAKNGDNLFRILASAMARWSTA